MLSISEPNRRLPAFAQIAAHAWAVSDDLDPQTPKTRRGSDPERISTPGEWIARHTGALACGGNSAVVPVPQQHRHR